MRHQNAALVAQSQNNATNILIRSQPLRVLFVQEARFNNQPVTKFVATNILPTGTADIGVRPGDNVKIEFIDDIGGGTQALQTQTGITFTINSSAVTIQNHSFSSNNPLYPNSLLNLAFSAPNMDSQMTVGGFYSFSFNSTFSTGIPNNFLVLKNLQISTFEGLTKGIKLYTCVFQSAAKAEDLQIPLGQDLVVGRLAYIYPYLSAPVPPRRVTENNVVVGFARDTTNQTTNLYLSSPLLSTITAIGTARNEIPLSQNYDLLGDMTIAKYDSFISRGIDTLTVDGTTTYDVVYHERVGEDPSVYLTVSNPPTLEQTVVMRRQISYDLLGIPLNITSINIISSTTITYEFVTPYVMPRDTSVYNLAFVIDYPYSVTWKVESLSNRSITLTVADTRLQGRVGDILEIPYINELRTIFIIPYTSLSSVATLSLGNPTTKIVTPASLCVGTSNMISTLTVNGDASINNTLLLQDIASGKPASVTYTDGTLMLGTSAQLQISADSIRINDNLNVVNNITCKQLIQISDCNLKTNITPSDPQTDLRKLLDLKVYSYTFKNKNDPSTYKGVLAQEVEQLLPDAVKEGEYTWDTKCLVHVFHEIVSLDDQTVLPNESFQNVSRIILYSEVTDKYSVHKVKKILQAGTWEVEPLPDVNTTHLTTLIMKTLMVNYDYLFSMTMNSLKTLDGRLTVMDKELLEIKRACKN
jgi:hypothetical protein